METSVQHVLTRQEQPRIWAPPGSEFSTTVLSPYHTFVGSRQSYRHLNRHLSQRYRYQARDEACYIQKFAVTIPADALLAASLQATVNRGSLSLYRTNHDLFAYGDLESAAAMNVASCDRLLRTTN
jgi:hypothetical protein